MMDVKRNLDFADSFWAELVRKCKSSTSPCSPARTPNLGQTPFFDVWRDSKLEAGRVWQAQQLFIELRVAQIMDFSADMYKFLMSMFLYRAHAYCLLPRNSLKRLSTC